MELPFKSQIFPIDIYIQNLYESACMAFSISHTFVVSERHNFGLKSSIVVA